MEVAFVNLVQSRRRGEEVRCFEKGSCGVECVTSAGRHETVEGRSLSKTGTGDRREERGDAVEQSLGELKKLMTKYGCGRIEKILNREEENGQGDGRN